MNEKELRDQVEILKAQLIDLYEYAIANCEESSEADALIAELAALKETKQWVR